MDKAYPRISLNSQQIQEIKDWEVGELYTIQITVQMTGVRKAESYDLPTQEIGEGTIPQNSVMVGDFNIIDAENVKHEHENDPSTYEEDYAKAMDREEVLNNEDIVITIHKK